MYNKIATRIADVLIALSGKENGKKGYKNVQVITYGLELILSSVVNLIFVLLIGYYLFGILRTIVFILFFCPIRQFAGGYHAKSYISCTIGYLVLFIITGEFVIYTNSISFCVWINIILIVFILLISPIDTENKRLNKQLRKKCKKRMKFILCMESVTIFVFVIFLKKEFLQATTMALIVESILLCLGKYMIRKEVK